MGDQERSGFKNPGDSELIARLERVGDTPRFLWPLFFLCMVPSILNGLNITSYVYFTDIPQHWCELPQLRNTSWTLDQILTISSPSGSNGSSCEYYDLDYKTLAEMDFADALNASRSARSGTKPCTSHGFDSATPSMVKDFDLVCERTVYKPSIQVAISIGKFLGAFIFGIISDKYGRRVSFFCGSLLYIVSGPLIAVAKSYGLLIIARIGIGAAGSGIYHSAFVILSEIASPGRRASIGILYNMSYPIGQMIVPIIAYFVRDWRTLQFILSAPAIFTLVFWWFLPESPMWLISKNRRGEAARYIYQQHKRLHMSEEVPLTKRVSDGSQQDHQAGELHASQSHLNQKDWKRALWEKLKLSFDQVYQLVRYGELRNRMVIAFFTWCVCSFSYYGLALNVDNFATDRYLYGFLTGVVEAPSYLLPLPLLRCMGRRHTAVLLFWVAGVALLLILALPETQGLNVALLVVASLGRMCVSGVFAVVILHTTEMFPTLLRNTAIGIGSTSSHIGSMSAPYFVDLIGLYWRSLPSTVFGVLSLLAGALTLLLPETKNRQLPNTVDDVIKAPKSARVGLHQVCH